MYSSHCLGAEARRVSSQLIRRYSRQELHRICVMGHLEPSHQGEAGLECLDSSEISGLTSPIRMVRKKKVGPGFIGRSLCKELVSLSGHW